MVEKSLDKKLKDIHANPNSKAFILADAKDADIAHGISSTGRRSPENHHGELPFRSIHEYRQQMREVVKQGLVDIMLMSPGSNEVLTIQEQLFNNSAITPAARVNDTTDVFNLRGSSYTQMYALPHRTATLDQLQCAKVECEPNERILGANLGLYSVTFNNDTEHDVRTLQAFKEFRMEAEKKGFRYFLEVFNPNVEGAVDPDKIPQYMVDVIIRTLAGLTQAQYPLFLKMVYQGPQATEELANFDPHLVIGVMGGSAGTTYDAFKLIAEAQKYGSRSALYGRKINNSENQLAFIQMLRLIVNGDISPEEAVRAYHGVLQGLNIPPYRSLEDDMKLTTQVMSYGGGASVTMPVGTPTSSSSSSASPSSAPAQQRPSTTGSNTRPRHVDEDHPDFDQMSPEEKLEYNQRERDRIFG